jgi:beta-glucanase (GH16 family)
MTRALALLAATGLAVTGAGCAGTWPSGSSAPSNGIVWTDEFNGPAGRPPDARRWSQEVGGRWGAGELEYYTDRRSNATLDGRGHLVITARRERYTGPDGVTRHFTSGRLSSQHRFSFAYGRVDARIRVARGQGLISGFWALGSDLPAVGWPASGEFDVAEVLGSDPGTVWGSLHGPDADGRPSSLTAAHTAGAPLDAAFHVYSVVWSPDRLEYLLDGRPYAVRKPTDLPEGSVWRFEHPFFLVLTLSVGGSWAGPPNAGTKFPATMTIDWIRVRRNAWTYCPDVAVRRFRDGCPLR